MMHRKMLLTRTVPSSKKIGARIFWSAGSHLDHLDYSAVIVDRRGALECLVEV